MTLTKRDQLWIELGHKIKTCGKYQIKEIACRKAYCNCGYKNDPYALQCANCGRRLRL